MRVASPVYGAEHRLPTMEPLTVMDFSWPPSIDAEGLHPRQSLQGMNHWIQQAHGLDEDVDRPALLAEAKRELSRVQGNCWTRVWLRPRRVISEVLFTRPSHGWPPAGPLHR